jgi:hypothetical protein
VPDALKTADLCLEAVQIDGKTLRWVPDALKTADLCLVAVQMDDNALKYVPETLKTADLYMAALRSSWMSAASSCSLSARQRSK